jgi:hypothetical protein
MTKVIATLVHGAEAIAASFYIFASFYIAFMIFAIA